MIAVSGVGVNIEREMEGLLYLTSSDFIAIAQMNSTARLRWNYVMGNENNRYEQMAIRIGLGLAGAVWRFGRAVHLDDSYSEADHARLNCPLMLAEHLKSASAYPIMVNSLIKGVLYIGKRSSSPYMQDDLLIVAQKLPRIVTFIEENIVDMAK
ncbi:hypothetical protein D3C73_714450 [compost metagenome]